MVCDYGFEQETIEFSPWPDDDNSSMRWKLEKNGDYFTIKSACNLLNVNKIEQNSLCTRI